MPCRYYCPVDREQVEITDYEKSSGTPVAVQRTQKSLDGISQKVLTDSLRSMEEYGIVTRTVYPEVPPRVEYALSDLGETMRPILTAMQEWGLAYKETFH